MKICTRAYLLGMLPALGLATLLVISLGLGRLADLEATLRDRGNSLAHYIAESAQYAAVSGNLATLEPVIERVRSEPDVVNLAIYRNDGHHLVGFGDLPPRLSLPLRDVMVETADHVAFSVPVKIRVLPMEDPFFPNAGTEASEREVAWVQLVMSRAGNKAIAHHMLLQSLVIVALGVLGTYALVHLLALTGIQPLMEIIEAVRRIGGGDLEVRLPLSAKSELRYLQAGVNQMSEALASHHQEMVARIEAATTELARQKETAEQANQAKSKFLAAASHDLRQPLHALALFTSSLKQSVAKPEQRFLADKIEASVNALEEMFAVLLDLSRLDAGALEVRREHFPLDRLFERLARDFADQAQDKGLRLALRPTSFWVHSDPVLLARVLSNLVSNALRYTATGGVLVGARRTGSQVRIQVWDTGIGIPPADLPRIVEEYFQVANAGRDRRRGLGLGLSIVDRVCGLLGHPLAVRSVEGRGSMFCVTVPWAETGHRDVPLAGERDWLRFGPGRVLVVEDDADSRAALASLFSGWGLDVTALEGDGEALAAYARGPEPACVISDYRLGEGEDGIALIQRLRAIWSQTLPALLVSGDTSADGMGHLVASGIPYLHKPVRPARLRAWLASVIKPKAENHP